MMAEIGLGNHYSWFNGSGSCRGIRIQASQRLPGVLRSHGMTANPELMQIVERVAYNDRCGQYELTETWQCCSEVIRAHMDREGGSTREQFRATVEYIRERYSPKPMTVDGMWEMDMMGNKRR